MDDARASGDEETVHCVLDASSETGKSARNRSNVWKYFSREFVNNVIYGVCQQQGCDARLKCITGSTSSLRLHIKSVHPVLHAVFQREEEAKIAKKKLNDAGSKGKSTGVQPCINNLFEVKANVYQPSHPRAKQISGAISRMMALDFQPYSIVQDTGFRNLLALLEPRYAIPHRTTFSRNLVPELYHKTRSSVANILAKECSPASVTALSFTTDIWTSRAMDPYISFTLSYVTENFCLRSFSLENKAFPGTHTAENIMESLEISLETWGIEFNTIPIFSVRDNGSNLVKALKNSSFFDISCFAHTLQLTINDAITGCEGLRALLQKSRRIVSHYHHSCIASERLHKQQEFLKKPVHKLVTSSPTRWNSDFKMMERLIEQREPIAADLAAAADVDNLTNTEWKLAEGFIKVLKPFNHATTVACGEKYVTLSLKIPLIYSLTEGLVEFLANPSNKGQGVTFARKLVSALKTRFATYKTVFPDCSCTLLDPRYKDMLFDLAEKQNAIDLLEGFCDDFQLLERCGQKKTLSSVKPGTSTHTGRSSPSRANPPVDLWSPLEKLRKIASEKCVNPSTVESPISLFEQLVAEMDRYLKIPPISGKMDAMKWWAGNNIAFPILAIVARALLGIPATQVNSERLNSSSGNVVSTKRGMLSTEHVSELTFLHENLCHFPLGPNNLIPK